MDKLLFDIIYAALTILAAIVVRYLVPYFTAKIDDTKLKNLISVIEKAMQCVESIYDAGCGEEKFQSVVNICKEWIEKHNVKITEDQLAILIQGIFVELDGYTLNNKEHARHEEEKHPEYELLKQLRDEVDAEQNATEEV